MTSGSERVEAAYRAMHQRLWRSLLAFTGDVHLASDAESEAFAQALRGGEHVVDVEAWVWRTAFKVAGGMLGARRREVPSDEISVEGVEVPAPVIELLGLLDDLSKQQRACVVLRYVGGLEPRHIAETLSTSPETVRVQLHRAHSHLRDRLTDSMREERR